ncbi:hypothetical protein GKG03_08765 [Finegoldia sp. BIOML-A3]|uniref:hypothetical protein n=1 Tax=unclassified Finegoldia TaxID=2619637 RepID=UPI0012B14663|nr:MULTISPECIES: hypothetical protein [unclassified Finegoldia]MSA99755.1 hypothetical protein [Finegoldia sp. BIOML-A3]MSB93741.1 hypothetical protein [Finegoldia sp. BIOML-A4]
MAKREPTEEEKHELLTSRFTAPFKAVVTGHFELTEKQKKENEKWEKELERRYGTTKYKD